MSTPVYSIILALVLASNAFPSQGYRYYQPGTVMLGGYYGMPPVRYPNILPQKYDPEPAASEDEFEREDVTEDSVIIPDEGKKIKEESTLTPPSNNGFKKSDRTAVPKKVTKRPNSKVPEKESFDSHFPFSSGGSGLFNTFFPIMVGGNSGIKGKSGESDGSTGGATAIANSFSTGRGGVASSHATSFGDVFLSSTLRRKIPE